jgi:hypothetical protein
MRAWGTHQWHDDLERHYSITPRKSLTLRPPGELNRENSLAFIVGYIDGDGCIRRQRRKDRMLTVALAGTHPMLSWVKQWFDRLAPPDRRAAVVRLLNKNGKMFSYQVSGIRALAVAQALLKIDLPRLTRKWRVVLIRPGHKISST